MAESASSGLQLFGANEQQPQGRRRSTQPRNHAGPIDIVALSREALVAINHYKCEICNKGFQREQNLQLHRRAHNLSSKLKVEGGPDPQIRRIYVCPELTCDHHHRSRALGDITAIKKHYLRKHVEKKFQCDKCTRAYALFSDLKAHKKTCGNKADQYKCECGSIFSKRDSFLGHQADCDLHSQDVAQNLPPVEPHQSYNPQGCMLTHDEVDRLFDLNSEMNCSFTELLLLADQVPFAGPDESNNSLQSKWLQESDQVKLNGGNEQQQPDEAGNKEISSSRDCSNWHAGSSHSGGDMKRNSYGGIFPEYATDH